MESIQNYSGFINLVFAGAVAISTIIYAILTSKLVRETRIMRKTQTEPIISASLIPHENKFHLLDLVIENTGYGTAYNVKFSIQPDRILHPHQKKYSEYNFMKNGIKCFSRGQKIINFFALLSKLNETELNETYTIIISYTNSYGDNYQNRFEFTLNEYADLMSVSIDTPEVIVSKSIKNIDNNFERMLKGYYDIGVAIKDEKAEEDNS